MASTPSPPQKNTQGCLNRSCCSSCLQFYPISIAHPVQEISTPCQPSPCGANAVCREQNGAGSCSCIDDYQGNPYEGCRPECVVSTDCPSDRACIRSKCLDPCPGTCGPSATCQVVSHLPSCTCVPGFTGDPFRYCSPIPPQRKKNAVSPDTFGYHTHLAIVEASPQNPCQPSPCGPNSQCREINQQAVCSCLPQYIGSPPGCRPECTVSTECPHNQACINQKCKDPCPGTCGLNAQCQVINHSPICSCRQGHTGDPFLRCYPIPRKFGTLVKVVDESVGLIFSAPPPSRPQAEYVNPCVPSPCGPYSQCRDTGGAPSCSCLPNYVGSPPGCRPECAINQVWFSVVSVSK